ncbi:MAG: isoprenylcysteine carboxylmethyltransferase family protein [Pirellulales bacterium]
MPLREELEEQGQWLFSWRSFLPLPLVALIAWGVCLPDHAAHRQATAPVWEWLCLAVCCAGLAVRALVIGHAPRRTSCRSTKHQVAHQLSTTGMYSIVRHPLYVGNFLIWLGLAMFTLLGWLVAVMALAYWLYYERIMLAEEEFLRRQFGTEFIAWSARTPAFIPKPGNWQRPSLAFSPRNVLRREYSGWLAVVVGFVALQLLSGFMGERRLQLDWPWAVALLSAAVLYTALRFLKRHTRLLKVEGR